MDNFIKELMIIHLTFGILSTQIFFQDFAQIFLPHLWHTFYNKILPRFYTDLFIPLLAPFSLRYSAKILLIFFYLNENLIGRLVTTAKKPSYYQLKLLKMLKRCH